MALDRTWYNTLVDDSGSGMDGSVWDKADVDALMDAIDAELARIDTNTGDEGTFTPTLSGLSGSSGVTYASQWGRWSRDGKFIHAIGYVQLSNKGTIAGSLVVGGLPFVSDSHALSFQVSPMWYFGLANPIHNLVGFFRPGTQWLELAMSWGGGVTALEAMNSTHITNTSAFMFNVTYKVP